MDKFIDSKIYYIKIKVTGKCDGAEKRRIHKGKNEN